MTTPYPSLAENGIIADDLLAVSCLMVTLTESE
jgi:hypothetical protein